MDGIGEEGGGIRLRKKFPDDNKPGSSAEVDYKTKAGTAWSHSYLNQKPWHPLSYPNQRRKWIAEQTHAQRVRRADEVAREYAQEQEFFRQTALISKKEKEKVEMMKAVSFMYVRPPGYNAESAKAAEIADERKKTDHNHVSDDHSTDVPSTAMQPESLPGGVATTKEKRKSRPKDVFGRSLPTEEEFEVLKNAPRLETGVPGRVKPFAVEVRNVKCLRCGNYGHQSGDRDCPLKDAIMPNEESRLKRDDPLTAIMAQMDPTEPLKWELKQKPGMSPPRGGFQPDDPNQQIVAEDIFDEYGGFLSGGNIPDLLTNISCKPKKRKSSKKSKHKRNSSPSSWDSDVPNQDGLSSKFDKHKRQRINKHSYSSEDSDSGRQYRTKESREKRSYTSEGSKSNPEPCGMIARKRVPESLVLWMKWTLIDTGRVKRADKGILIHPTRIVGMIGKAKTSIPIHPRTQDCHRHEPRKKTMRKPYNSEDSDIVRHNSRREKYRLKHHYSSEDDAYRHLKGEKSRHKHSSSCGYEDYSNSDSERRSKHHRRHY
ncbi:hypothetical protein GOBAR_DD04802 [Gossypium barbadense]|nr:hypothetical protein GOBAR_DD04802 [Gossypium barbadense]